MNEGRLDALAQAFLERLRAGERPSIKEYVRGHPELAAEIRDLFPTLVLLEDLATDDTLSEPMPGQLGEYRILREVGRGGMGVVYEAEHVPLGRRVALKVLPYHKLMDATVLERFRREAQAAARLHHTNIVPVFGVGEHDGVPFYAMQFLRGQALDDVIAELRRMRRGSSAGLKMPGSEDSRYFRSVARIGAQVADALAYAHAEGVLHRDIKPSNLILDAKGSVWITDFGLARTEATDNLTQTGDLVGTLTYMAPERFQGWSDVRSDIYGLGLVLYELLTLRPAFADENRGKLIRRVMEANPAPPRRSDRAIPRDLETIVMKALAKEAGERYVTAAEMAADLRRYMSGEPIDARRSGVWDRTVKWVRRRPTAAALVGVSLFAVLLGLAGSVYYNARLSDALARTERERTLAQANLAHARGAVKKMLQTVGWSDLEHVPGTARVRRELLQEALVYCKGFLTQAGDDPEPHLDVAETHRMIGDIQAWLGNHREAESECRAAIAVLDALPRSFHQQDQLARAHAVLGRTLHALDRRRAADAAQRRSLAIWGALLERNPDSDYLMRETARACHDLGVLLGDRHDVAQEFNERALALLRRIAEPRDYDRHLLAHACLDLALQLDWQGKKRDAEPLLEEALAITSVLLESSPFHEDYRKLHVRVLTKLGLTSFATGRTEEAIASLSEATDGAQALVGDYPDVPDYAALLARCQGSRGMALVLAGEVEEGLAIEANAVETWDAVVARHPDLFEFRMGRARCLLTLGGHLAGAGSKEDAGTALERAVADVEALLDSADHTADLLHVAAAAFNNLGQFRMAQRRQEEAETLFLRALAVQEELVTRHPEVPLYKHLLGGMLCNRGNQLRAAGRLLESRECLERGIGYATDALAVHPNRPDFLAFQVNLHVGLARTLLALDEKAEAADAARVVSKLRPRSWVDRRTSGTLLVAAGAHEEACERFREALELAADESPARRLSIRASLIDALIRADAFDQAAASVDAFAALRPDEAVDAYNAACFMARCAAADSSYADRAMEHLREAVARGWRDAAHTRGDPDLAPLRERQDFRALLSDLENR